MMCQFWKSNDAIADVLQCLSQAAVVPDAEEPYPVPGETTVDLA